MRFRYEIVSSQCLMVYSQDPSVGRSFKINYTDGTSDEILLRIDTDVVLGDDLVAYQETMFNAFIWGKQQDGYEICYTGESSIHSFEGGIATVSIPFIVPEGDNPEFYRVYYVSPEGELLLVNSSYADGEISFSTFHFSDYVVIRSEEPLAELEPAPEVQEVQPVRNISSVYIAIAIGVVVILGACLICIKIRRQKTN